MSLTWTGPNPFLPPIQGGPWAGNLLWNEARNWNNQGIGGTVPDDSYDTGFDFSPPGPITGGISFKSCTVGGIGAPSIKVQLEGVNCIEGVVQAQQGAQLDIVSGSGVFIAFMARGVSGSSGTLNGGSWTMQDVGSGTGGSALFENLTDFILSNGASNIIAAVMGSVTGFSPLTVGNLGGPYTGGGGAQLDIFGGGDFTGGVTSRFAFINAPEYLPKLNLKSMNAAGAAGQPINVYGGQVTFTVPAWLGHPIILDPAHGSPSAAIALYSDTSVPLVVSLPDAREVGIRNSGADWRVYCTVEVNQFSGGFGNVNGFVGIDDFVRVTTAAALTTLKVKGKHFYGNLSFDAGGKVEF